MKNTSKESMPSVEHCSVCGCVVRVVLSGTGQQELTWTPINVVYTHRYSAVIGPHDDLLSIVKTRKLRWYGHITRATGLANTIMQGTVPSGRRRGRPKKCWHDNIKEWTELPLAKTLRLAEDRDGWRKIIKTSVVPLQPPNS